MFLKMNKYEAIQDGKANELGLLEIMGRTILSYFDVKKHLQRCQGFIFLE